MRAAKKREVVRCAHQQPSLPGSSAFCTEPGRISFMRTQPRHEPPADSKIACPQRSYRRHTLGRMQPRCQQLLALLEECNPDASGIVAAYDLGFVDYEPAALPALRALAVHVVLDRVLECVLPHVLHATIHSEVFCELYRVAL